MESVYYFEETNKIALDVKTKKEADVVADAYKKLFKMEYESNMLDDALYHFGMYVELIKLSEQIKEEE